MPIASCDVAAILWDALSQPSLPRLDPIPEPSLVPPEHADLLTEMKLCLARAWRRRQPELGDPASLGAALEQLAPDSPLRAAIERQCLTIQTLLAMSPEQIQWTKIEESRPTPGAAVLYFFQWVGTHPGRYEGQEEGLDLFVGDFGGFLGGDVTHWMTRPL